MKLGMNCHLKTKFSYHDEKLEIEKLYSQIKQYEQNKELEVTYDDTLKCEFKRYGLSVINTKTIFQRYVNTRTI